MPRTSMNDERQRIDISKGVKMRLREIRKSLDLKSDSETVAYLEAVFNLKYSKLTLPEDRECRDMVKELHDQQIFGG